MTFQQLQYLQEVSRTGSISGAAKNLFLAQSSVSASISNLEEELGYPIFIRGKKGVIPTAQGAEVIEQAARICQSYRTMMEGGNGGKKHIRISASMIEPLDEALVELVTHYAEDSTVTFSVDAFSITDSVRKLISFELDVAVFLNHESRSLSVDTLVKSRNLTLQTIATLPVIIQIGPGHPLYEKEHVEICDLQEFLFVDSVDLPLIHNEFLRGIIQLSSEKTVTVKSSYAKYLLIGKGLGYSIGAGAPEMVAQAMGLRSIPLKDVNYRLAVVTNPQKPMSREVETYIRYIKKAFGKS